MAFALYLIDRLLFFFCVDSRGAKRRSQPFRRAWFILKVWLAHVPEFGRQEGRLLVLDFEIFGAGDTSGIFCWTKNVGSPERHIFVTGLDKKVRAVRL